MEIRDYVAAVGRRWLWVAVAALSAAVLAAGSAFLAPDAWRSTTTVYVGASSSAGPEGAAYAARVPDDVLPSLVRLARSPAVLGPVVDRLDLATTPYELARGVEVSAVRKTSVLTISATTGNPRESTLVAGAVAEELAARTGELFSSDTSALLSLTTVRPATEPRFSTGPGTSRNGILGLAGGAALAVVACGLLELARPRVRTGADVARLTDAPVLAELPAPGSSRAPGGREAAVDRLRWTLGPGGGDPAGSPAGRLLVLGGGGLAGELGAVGGRLVVDVPGPAALPDVRPGEDDAVLLVVDGGRATGREVRQALAALTGTSATVLGVVVDGVLPRRPRTTSLLSAALRGRSRLPAVLEHTRTATGTVSGTGAAALVGLFLVGLHRPIALGATTGLVAVVALLPLWLPVVRRVRAMAWLAGLTGAALVSGLLLARSSLADHGFARFEAVSTGLLVLTMTGAVGLLLWARTVLPLPTALPVLAVGLGLLVDGLLRSPGSVNAFKFELTVPVTVVVLALLALRRRAATLVATVTALGALALTNLAFDARSAAGFCVLAAVLTAWQVRPVLRPRGGWWGRTTLTLGLGAVGAYAAFSELLLSGLAGAELQQRTATQIEQSGSLLLGGRPEWTATWALMQENPLGFGLGTVPSASDVAVAKEGMSVAHIPTAEGYIENYLFAGRFELHSIVADLWSNLGLLGLLLGLSAAGLLVQRLSVLLQRREASALMCFVTLNALWALAFGPLPTDVLVVSLALGLLLPAPSTTTSAPPAEPEEPRRPEPAVTAV